jgi:hypothetical protein
MKLYILALTSFAAPSWSRRVQGTWVMMTALLGAIATGHVITASARHISWRQDNAS